MRKVLLCFVAVFAFCDDDLLKIIKLTQEAEMGKISSINTKSTQLELESTKRAYLPTLSIEGGHTRSNQSIFLPNKASQLSAKIDFLIYDGGAREANLNALRSLAKSSELKQKELYNQLALNISKLYFSLKSLKDAISAKEAELEYLDGFLNKVQKLYDAGLASADELAGISARLALSRADMADLAQKQDDILNQIYTMANSKNKLSLNSSFIEPNFNHSSKNYLIESLEYESIASNFNKDKASAAYLPSIFFSAAHTRYNRHYKDIISSLGVPAQAVGQYSSVIENSGLFKKSGHYNELMLGFKWDIFNFNKTSLDIQKASILSQKAKLNLEYKKRENSLKLQKIKKDLKTLLDVISLRQDALNFAKISQESSQKRYEAGLVSYTDVLMATSVVYEAKSALSLAISQREIKKAEYYYELGQDIINKVKL